MKPRASTDADTRRVRSVPLAGLVLVATTVIGLTAWSAVATVDEAVPVTGKITYGGDSIPVLHATGGSVAQVLVKDGQHVRKGQALFVVRDSGERAMLQRIRGQLTDKLVQVAYLKAAASGLTRLGPIESPDGSKLDPQRVADLTAIYQAQLDASGDASDAQAGVVEQQQEHAEKKRRDAKAEIAALTSERAELEGELAKATNIVQSTSLSGQLTQIDAQIDAAGSVSRQASDDVASLDAQLEALATAQPTDYHATAAGIETEIQDLASQKREARKALDALTVRAPTAGALHAATPLRPGVILLPGGKPFEIIPDGEDLIVNLSVPPADIDSVATGSSVDIVLSGLGPEASRELRAEVVRVPPDVTVDESSGFEYYKVAAKVTHSGGQSTDLRILAGMQAQAYIKTGRASVLSYLLDPLTDQLRKPVPAEAD